MADENNNMPLSNETSSTDVVNSDQISIDNSTESTLTDIGKIILIIGLILAVFCLFTICWIDSGKRYDDSLVFNPIGLAITVGIALSSLLIWSLLNVIANISITLKEIKAKLDCGISLSSVKKEEEPVKKEEEPKEKEEEPKEKEEELKEKEEEPKEKIKNRRYVICVSRLVNGNQGVTIATRSNILRLWDEMALNPDIIKQKWIVTTDPYFGSIPISENAKIHYVPSEILASHLQGAQELERIGNNITIKR